MANTTVFITHRTWSVSCMTCASSSFSPLAVGIAAAAVGILLADEGLDVGVEDLGVVALTLDAPVTQKSIRSPYVLFRAELLLVPKLTGQYRRWENWLRDETFWGG